MENLQLIKHVGIILLGLVFSLILVQAIHYFNPGLFWHVEKRLISVIFLVAGVLLLLVCSTKEVLLGMKHFRERLGKSDRKRWTYRVVYYFLTQSTTLVEKYFAFENVFIFACGSLILLLFYKKLVAFTWLAWFFSAVIIVSFIALLGTKPESASKN